MNSATPHPGHETLLRYIDEDLDFGETERVAQHVATCKECRDDLEALRGTLDDYRLFHRDVLKASLPSPPRDWAPLEFPDIGRKRSFPLRWLAAAAAVALLFLVLRRVDNVPEVRAAELLRKAVASEESSQAPASRIRIRTRTRVLDRAARVPSGTEIPGTGPLRAQFDAAGYSWDDPLSARAFSRWRDTVRQKRVQVTENADAVVVQTSAATGELDDAALTMRTTDFRAIACRLHFRSTGETIDITEVPAVPESAGSASSPTASPVGEAKPASPADELRVISALHGIGADLGEPIEVQREGGRVLVSVTGLTAERRRQIQSAVRSLPDVELRFESLTGGSSPAGSPNRQAAPPATTDNPLLRELQALRGDDTPAGDLTDQLIDALENASERAYALRALARRFPPDISAKLTHAESQMLHHILLDHAAKLALHLETTRRLLAPILRQPARPAASAGGTEIEWQRLSDSLPTIVEHLDRTLNGANDATDARKAEISRTLADLERATIDLQAIAKK
jgi:hypothetical protein